MPKLVQTFLLLSSAQSIAARSTAGLHSTKATQHKQCWVYETESMHRMGLITFLKSISVAYRKVSKSKVWQGCVITTYAPITFHNRGLPRCQISVPTSVFVEQRYCQPRFESPKPQNQGNRREKKYMCTSMWWCLKIYTNCLHLVWIKMNRLWMHQWCP